MYTVIEYYDPLTPTANLHERGQFWWACIPFLPDNPRVTRFWPNQTTETLDVTTFDPRAAAYDAAAKTEADEFLAIQRFKRRPVVILSQAGTQHLSGSWKGGEFFLVAPVYSLRKEPTKEYRFDKHVVWGMITYKFNSLFYLPKSDKYDISEAVVRFERIISIHKSWLERPRSAQLSHDGMVCFEAWLRRYMFRQVPNKWDEDLDDYRNMVGADPQITTGLFGGTTP